MGCDPALDLQPYTSSVSIHAPTWGATSRWVRPARVFRFQSTHPRGVRLVELFPIAPNHSFNPRTHVGCDLSKHRGSYFLKFQSTHPRGVRRCSLSCPSATTGFNPRTHVGCDPDLRKITKRTKFQSTHPRRVRLAATVHLQHGIAVSIHAPT